MNYSPKNDGLTHINVYSRAETLLGRWLSNFAYTPIDTEDGYFESIEGYWYWLSCKDERMRKVSGYEAKKLGRLLKGDDWVHNEHFRQKIKKAIKIKLDTDPERRSKFLKSTLPLTHYYYYGNMDRAKIVMVPEGDWIIEYLEEYRREYRCLMSN